MPSVGDPSSFCLHLYEVHCIFLLMNEAEEVVNNVIWLLNYSHYRSTLAIG